MLFHVSCLEVILLVLCVCMFVSAPTAKPFDLIGFILMSKFTRHTSNPEGSALYRDWIGEFPVKSITWVFSCPANYWLGSDSGFLVKPLRVKRNSWGPCGVYYKIDLKVTFNPQQLVMCHKYWYFCPYGQFTARYISINGILCETFFKAFGWFYYLFSLK